MKKRIDFLKVALKNMKTAGTIVPSSRFLAQKMLRDINFSSLKLIVELGPGNGVITQEILKRIQPDSQLVCFEVNPVFYQQLQQINHPQLTVLHASAVDMVEALQTLGFSNACHIISSIPLTLLPKEDAIHILKNALQLMHPNGTFIQYQYSLSYYRYLKSVFKEEVSLDFEVLNIPPAFVYRCKKLN